MESLNISRKQKLHQLNVPLHPFGATVGDEYYIFFFDVLYKLHTSARCLECLYKLFHALNLEYPLEGKDIWEVIQELVFKSIPKKRSSNVAQTITDLKFHLKKIMNKIYNNIETILNFQIFFFSYNGSFCYFNILIILINTV